MYRFLFTPKWLIFHAIVLAAIVLMVNLGFWQLRRLDERKEFNATVEARYDADPVPIDELLGSGAALDEIEWRPVTASGTYLPDRSVVVVNRSQHGAAGRNVVVPLELADGRILLVNRGFVPLIVADVPDVPATDVEVLGRVRQTQERRLGQLSDPADGVLTEVQRVDIARLSEQLPGEVLPMYLDLAESNPPEVGGLPEAIAPPDLSERNHLSYAVQWFIFSIAVAVGWCLAVRRSLQTRRRQQADGATDEATVPDGSPDDRLSPTR